LKTINPCESIHAHFNALFYRAHHKIVCSCICTEKKNRMRPTSKWEESQHEDLRNQLH
jgi:hypothetical protein